MATSDDSGVTLIPVVLPADGGDTQPVESACLALEVISHYAHLTGTSKTAPVRELAVNLVADLMHLCGQSGISYEAVAEEAAALVDSDCDGAFIITGAN